MPPKLLVIADDLTGANDTGVQFAKRQIPSIVWAEPEAAASSPGFEVVVINTASRHLSPAEAAARVRRATRWGLAAGIEHFFKKTDSTLRGNLGAELEALCRETGAASIPFVPAFPVMGRTTRAGIHYVHGRPISETAFARDPLNPISESDVPALLRRQTTLPVTCCQPGRASSAAGLVVYDCETTADLEHIARGLQAANQLKVLAGSAALAEQWPALLPFAASGVTPLHPHRPWLLVNGSLHETALAQIQAASPNFWRKIPMPFDQLVQCGQGEPAQLMPAGSASPGSLSWFPPIAPGENLLLYSVEDAAAAARFRARSGLEPAELCRRVARRTGQWVAALLRQYRFPTLVVFGGDTLAEIARAAGWKSFVPISEPLPGVTLARPTETDLAVISKAGGFGPPNLLHQLTLLG